MKTLGLEMVDAGFEVAVGRAATGGGRREADRLVPPGTVPAIALVEEGELHLGLAAETRRYLFPRQLNDSFWEEMSLQPSNLRRGGRPARYSEIAYSFLRSVIDGLPGVASERASLVLAVPPAFTEPGERAEERIGILLGICRDLELRLGALVDVACAALLDPETEPPPRGQALVVDLGLHAAVLTLLDVDGAIAQRAVARLAGSGWLGLMDLAHRMLAQRFLRQTSFDVTAERRTEQEFHDQTRAALETFTSQAEAWLRITSVARERVVSIPRDNLAADLRPLAETIAQGAVEFLQRHGRTLSNVSIYLTSRARHVCGLPTALRARGALGVTVLSAGAAARGAAALACERPAVAELGDVPIETSIVPPGQAADLGTALRSAFNIHRHDGRRDATPTHVVVDGIAHGLRAGGLRIPAGMNGRATEMAVALTPIGVGPCEIVVNSSGGRWQISFEVDGRPFGLPGGDTPLAAGDVLEVRGTPGTARLMFVRVSG